MTAENCRLEAQTGCLMLETLGKNGVYCNNWVILFFDSHCDYSGITPCLSSTTIKALDF